MRGHGIARPRSLSTPPSESGAEHESVEPERAAVVTPRAVPAGNDELTAELYDVPAAIVCASCGSPECPGCAVEEPTHASGVVAIVPWERPGLGLVRRVWTTARLSTTTDSFFAALPDGDAQAALRFAVIAELAAVMGLLMVAAPIVLVLVPWLAAAIIKDAALRDMLLRALGWGIPGVALGMVVLHAVYGVCLDLGARRVGARAKKSRGLRFGLYACGWDLVTLPLGWLLVALTEGPRAALKIPALGLTIPSRAARAYLRGVHQLEEARARRAAQFAGLLTALIALVGLSAAALVAIFSA